MARIVGGSPLGELSGKMGGLVFARNKGGAYVRQYAIPINPNTVAQVNARALFGASVANWHSLTPAQKANWENYAQQIYQPLNNANGATFSGINAFTALSAVVANANAKLMIGNANNYSLFVDDITEITIDVENSYSLGLNPPAVYNTGTLYGSVVNPSPEPANFNLEIRTASLNELLNWQVTFDVVAVSNEGVAPTSNLGTGNFNLGTQIQNTTLQDVGFSCYMSESFNQLGDFVVNPFKIHLGTTALIGATATNVTGEYLKIVSNLSPLNRNDYQALPSPGDKVRLTFVMIDRYGQRKMIGSRNVNVTSS